MRKSRAKVWGSVVGKRRTNAKKRENYNNEPMKSMNSRIGEPLAGAGTEFTSRTMNSGGWKVGKGGKVERKMRRFFPSFPTSSLLFPPFPTFSHFIFICVMSGPSGAWNQGGDGRTTETQRHRAKRSVDSEIRSQNRRWCEIMREKFGFPSPPRDGCPIGVVRWRETWSGCCAKVRIVSRKCAKVHESSHRSGP